MAIDADTVRRVARLAHIKTPEDRLAPLAQELDGIMRWIDQLDEVDTQGVEPMACCVVMDTPFREDVVTDGGDPEVVLSNAPRRVGNFYVVPKVVE